MIGIAGAGPVAERHGGGNAALARVNDPSVFRGEAAEVEQVELDPGGLDDLARDLDKAKGLGHLARAGLVGTRRAADAEDAQRCGGIAMALLRQRDRVAGGNPVQRQVVVGVGMARASLARVRRLAVAVIRIPGKVDQAPDLRRHGIERGIVESVAEAARDLALVDLRAALALADVAGIIAHGSLVDISTAANAVARRSFRAATRTTMPPVPRPKRA